MKRIYNIIGIALIGATVLVSCGGEKTKKTFNPQERTSSYSEDERANLIAQKKAELGVNPDSLIHSHGVKFSILQPIVKGDITADIADRLCMKMLQIASQNGISGLGTSPGFVLGAEIAQTGRAATGTAPQKMTVQYEMTFKVMNLTTGDVYATAVQQVIGAGNSFEEASQNAVKEIKNTQQMQQMLATASDRIIKWYNENVQVVANQVDKAEKEGNYSLALALLSSVPEQAKTAFAYATKKQPETLKGMLHKQAADMLGEMEAAMASAGEDFDASIGAYFRLIPTDAPEHAKAKELYDAYAHKCKARRDALEAKAERDEQAARELEKFRMIQEHETELAEIEADKIKAKYEAQASANAVAAQAKGKERGLLGSLGYAIGGVADRVFAATDAVGSFIGEKMFGDD